MAKARPATQPQTATDVEQPTERTEEEEEEEEEETPQMNTISAIVLLVVATVLIGFTSEWLVDSLDGLTQSTPLTEAWVGLILLPIGASHALTVGTLLRPSRSRQRRRTRHASLLLKEWGDG